MATYNQLGGTLMLENAQPVTQTAVPRDYPHHRSPDPLLAVSEDAMMLPVVCLGVLAWRRLR